MMAYHIDESVYSLFSTQGMPETVYKYFSMVLVADILKLNPALLGAEVIIPRPGEDYMRKPVPSDWGSALFVQIPGGRERFDVLGILDDKTLVVVEVERAGALARLLKEDPGYVAALVSAFNGGGVEGGRVSSAFSARPSLAVLEVGDPRDVPVKFVAVLADRGRAAFFIFDTTLGQLMDVNYLNNVAERIYGVYKNIESYSRSRYGTVEDVVDSVIDRYSSYSPVVKLLK
ncbi:MAG: hypothetical protein ACP5H5_08390 [Pyrobaculum sp.]